MHMFWALRNFKTAHVCREFDSFLSSTKLSFCFCLLPDVTIADEHDVPSTSSSASSAHEDDRTDYHRNDEQVAVCMECHRY